MGSGLKKPKNYKGLNKYHENLKPILILNDILLLTH